MRISNTALQRLARPTISKKFALFYLALLLVALANGLIINSALVRLRGTSAIIDAAGSLRWVIEKSPA